MWTPDAATCTCALQPHLVQILSENLIPFVAIDTGTDCVAAGKAQDLPVYYGDAGSPAVLHLLGR